MIHCSPVLKRMKTKYVVVNEGRVIMSSISFSVASITSEVNYEYFFFILLRNVCRCCCVILRLYRGPITYLK